MKAKYIRIASRTVQADHQIYILRYDLIIDKLQYFNSTVEEYGVSVTAVCGRKKKTNEVRCITCNPDCIMYTIRMVIYGMVFPDQLDETLENILN